MAELAPLVSDACIQAVLAPEAIACSSSEVVHLR